MTKEKVLSRLAKLKIVILPSGCHVIDKPVSKSQYPKMGIDYKSYKVCRLILFAYHDVHYHDYSKESRHLCNYKPCINPKHVVPGSTSDNTKDQVAAGIHNHASKTNCIKCGYSLREPAKRFGHDRGKRYCPNCRKERRK